MIDYLKMMKMQLKKKNKLAKIQFEHTRVRNCILDVSLTHIRGYEKMVLGYEHFMRGTKLYQNVRPNTLK